MTLILSNRALKHQGARILFVSNRQRHYRRLCEERRFGWSHGLKLVGIVAEGKKGRMYAEATLEQEAIGLSARPKWRPEYPLSTHPQYMSVTNYGPSTIADLFMARQTLALNTFAEKLIDMHQLVEADAIRSGPDDDGRKPITAVAAQPRMLMLYAYILE